MRLDGVCFRYPGTNRDVLKQLDLEIRAGEFLGLVGINGAGKSTLVNLLGGAYRPTEGRVIVDGVDLASLDDRQIAAWQRRLAIVTQDHLHLPLTAAENVMLAAPKDQELLEEVTRQAGLDSAVRRLPRGWDTVMDRTVAAGGELSGGQWQRLALARALYAVRSGAMFMVLDEPASALDVHAEKELVDKYMELTRDTTSVAISHRFSVVRGADRICVLDSGSIRESGTHTELLEKGGWYAQMFAIQAARFGQEVTTVEAGE
ncbi:ATP-binding cassette domain-containing protein [Promicromonospora sp. MS192]|uniref:ATP-binding cassette domain-containing protein n=1 Tax=Promicromonospora sp. MS192 TaxID=3412684 RepID=UPI003C2FB46A